MIQTACALQNVVQKNQHVSKIKYLQKDTACCWEYSTNDGQHNANNEDCATEQDIKVLLAETRLYVLDKSIDLAEAKHSQCLQKQTIKC